MLESQKPRPAVSHAGICRLSFLWKITNNHTIARRRRIKCDEGRPGCLRCSKAGFECDRYGDHSRESSQKTPRQVLPKPPQAVGLPRICLFGPFSIGNQVEYRYIHHFQNKTTSGFQELTDWSILSHLVLQLCHHESFIWDSVVAIGALIRSLEAADSSKPLLPRDSRLTGPADMHRQFALFKYGKAVKSMQAVLPDAEPRRVLIACLLVFCFECFLNNRHLALSHVTTGHRLLQDWLAGRKQGLQRNRIRLSPAPITVEDELVEAFENLDLQISTVYDSRPLETHKSILTETRNVVEQMPSTFNDLMEAQRYLNLVMRRCHHFLATSWSSSEASSLSRDFSVKPPGDVTVITGINIYSTSYKVSDNLRAEQREFGEEVLRWSQAFEPLFKRTRQRPLVGCRNYVRSTLLRIHAIATSIVIAGVLFTEELSYDDFLPQFQELLGLINAVVAARASISEQTPSGGAGFVLSLGITAPLYLMVTRCRDRTLRRKAIETLRGWYPEACWDPSLIAEMGVFIMEVEEEGVADAVIPERSRAVVTSICEAPKSNHGKQHALVQVTQRCGGPDGETVWKERMISWK